MHSGINPAANWSLLNYFENFVHQLQDRVDEMKLKNVIARRKSYLAIFLIIYLKEYQLIFHLSISC